MVIGDEIFVIMKNIIYLCIIRILYQNTIFFSFYFCDNLLEKLDVNHILRKMKIHQKRLNLKVILTLNFYRCFSKADDG